MSNTLIFSYKAFQVFFLTCFAPRFRTRHCINAVCPVYTVRFLNVVCCPSMKYGSIFNSGPIGIPTTFAEGPLVAMIGIPTNVRKSYLSEAESFFSPVFKRCYG